MHLKTRRFNKRGVTWALVLKFTIRFLLVATLLVSTIMAVLTELSWFQIMGYTFFLSPIVLLTIVFSFVLFAEEYYRIIVNAFKWIVRAYRGRRSAFGRGEQHR